MSEYYNPIGIPPGAQYAADVIAGINLIQINTTKAEKDKNTDETNRKLEKKFNEIVAQKAKAVPINQKTAQLMREFPMGSASQALTKKDLSDIITYMEKAEAHNNAFVKTFFENHPEARAILAKETGVPADKIEERLIALLNKDIPAKTLNTAKNQFPNVPMDTLKHAINKKETDPVTAERSIAKKPPISVGFESALWLSMLNMIEPTSEKNNGPIAVSS